MKYSLFWNKVYESLINRFALKYRVGNNDDSGMIMMVMRVRMIMMMVMIKWMTSMMIS